MGRGIDKKEGIERERERGEKEEEKRGKGAVYKEIK